MKLVMTMLVRDEADIIDDQIAFHIAAGVDFVVAGDNDSTDGTKEILHSYAREGLLHYISVPDPVSQVESVTKMARLAATRFGADWVINSDADEFWWARGATLKEVLRLVPTRFGGVRGMWRNFVARPPVHDSFAERMTVRWQSPTREIHPFNTHFKTVHRGSPLVEVGGGNHDALGPGLAPVPGWYPIDILHFPIRSYEQFERKFIRRWEIEATDGRALNPYYDVVRDAQQAGRLFDLYSSYVVDDRELVVGLANGELAEDTRLRQALRALPGLDNRDSQVDRGYLVELGYIEENGPFVRAERSIEALESRVSRLERSVVLRLLA